MRKITVELRPNGEASKMKTWLFNKIKSIEAIQILKTDFDRGMRMGVCILTMKDGFSLSSIEPSDGLEVLDLMKAEENRYTCFIKVRVPEEHRALMKRFDMDLIWDTPTIISEDKMTMSAIGDKYNLKAFLENIKALGEIESIKCQLSAYHRQDILSCLTDRQKEIIMEAKRMGYYDYPRRINGNQLAEKVGISKASTIEHLRKAEARIMASIFSGY
jgi:predicted DNA binding protein